MKQKILLLIAVFYTIISSAQVYPDKYWVRFTDKNDSPYSINNPEEFLSQRAIDRRTTQGIDIVESDLPVNPSYIQQVTETGVVPIHFSKWLNSMVIYTTDQDALNTINSFSFVLSVEKSVQNGVERKEKFEKPFFANESLSQIPETAILKSISGSNTYDYGMAYNQINMLNGIGLHDMGYDGTGMIIAVLDAGFLNTNSLSAFDYLYDNGRILGTKDFVDPYNPNIYNSHYHGTMVLSTIAANLPGEMVGTAPEAEFYLLRSEDGDSEYLIEELNWVTAAEYADSVGADVINSSLGYTEFDDPSQDHTYEDMDGNTTPITIGADFAASKGILVVNSAGNSGGSSWQYIGAPADGDEVFSIGAVNGSGNYASFSSTGPTYDGRIKPNVVAQGQGTTVISAYSGDVTSGNGTSFSSPVTAGMVACLWSADPLKRNTEIMEAVQSSGTLATNPNNDLGYGIPDYMLALDLLTDAGTEHELSNDVAVGPNPFSDHINIDIAFRDNDSNRVIKLTDITGKILFEKSYPPNYNYIDINGLNELSSGIYLLSVKIGDNEVVRKVLK